MQKNCLLTAGIIAIVTGVILTLTLIGAIAGLPSIAGGILLLYYSSKNSTELYNCRNDILTWAILLIFLSFPASIFTFIAYNAIHKKEELQNKDKMSPEVFKLSLIMNLGVLLVVSSIIIFATTSWESFSDVFKISLMSILGILFIALSLFIEKKIKIKLVSITYWLLGLSFLISSYLGVGNFELFGNWFSLNGSGSLLFVSSVLAFGFILIELSYLKFKSKWLLYLNNVILPLGLTYFLLHFNLDKYIIFILLSLYALGKILPVSSKHLITFKNFSKLGIYIVGGLLIIQNLILTNFNEPAFIGLLSTIILTTTSYLDIMKNKFNPIILLIPLMAIVTFFNAFGLTLNIYLILTSAIIFIFNFCNSFIKDKIFSLISNILGNIFLFILLLISLGAAPYVSLIIASLLVLIDVKNKICNNNVITYEKYIEPIKYLILIFTAIHFTNTIISVTIYDAFWISSLILFIIGIIVKNPTLKLIYAYISSTSAVIAGTGLILQVYDAFIDLGEISLLTKTLSLGLIILNFISFSVSKDSRLNNLKTALFVILLVFTYSFFNELNTSMDYFGLSYLICILSYLGLMLIFDKNKLYKLFIIFISIIPFMMLVESFDINNGYNIILNSFYTLIVLFSICGYLIGSIKSRNIALIVGLSMIYLFTIFNASVSVAIYSGITSLIFILVGLFNKKYYSLLIMGSIITIVNLIYQLYSLWAQLPWWLYLLIAGLILIGIVTFKLIKEEKTEKIEDKKIEDRIFTLEKDFLLKLFLYSLLMFFILLFII